MLRLGSVAHSSYIPFFQGLKTHFQRRGIDLDWVLYSDWDAVVDAFVTGEIDLSWNGPLAYVKIKRRLDSPCRVVAMRDVDVSHITHFITHPESGVATVEQLKGKRFALASRGSVEAGLLAYHYLKQLGIDPSRDLASCTFHEERQPSSLPGERDVVERVREGEYDAGAVSRRTLEVLEGEGKLPRGSIRVLWSSPGYSHCCFTAQSDMEAGLSQRVTEAFVSVDYADPAGKALLDSEGCKAFVPGTTEGWETLEQAAQGEYLI